MLMKPSMARSAIWPIALLFLVLIVGTVATIAQVNSSRLDQNLREKLALAAGIAAPMSVKALWELDPNSARYTLETLSTDPDFQSAVVFETNGEIFAQYPEQSDISIDPNDYIDTIDAEESVLINLPTSVIQLSNLRAEDGSVLGYGFVEFSTARASQAILQEGTVAVLIGIVALFSVCFLLALLIKGVTRPIEAVTERMKSLADGETEAPIPALDRKDEVGDIAKALEVFRVGIVANRAAEERFRNTVMSVVQDLVQSGTVVRDQAGRVAEIIEQNNASCALVDQQAKHAVESSRNIAEVTSELELATKEIVTQQVKTQDVIAAVNDLGSQTNNALDDLSKAATEISEVVAAISSIAEKTNMLALNATIEAARAGDAGRGFAVVASEVKQLASECARATDMVTTKLSAINGSVAITLESMGGFNREFSTVSEMASTIAVATEEQTVSTSAISNDAQNAAEQCQNVTKQVVELNLSGAEAQKSASSLNEAVESMSAKTKELTLQVNEFLDQISSHNAAA